MIGKIAKSGSNFLGCLLYNQLDKQGVQRGQIVHLQGIDYYRVEDLTMEDIATEMDMDSKLNEHITKSVHHASLSFPHGELPSMAVQAKIVKDYAKYYGLQNNALVGFLHTDKAHAHIHIVACKINKQGINTYNDKHNVYRLGSFCRMMEAKYNLIKVKQMDSLRIDGKGQERNNKHHQQLREVIDEAIVSANDFSEMLKKIKQNGYEIYVGVGITFIDKQTGEKMRGSDLGRGYSKLSLMKKIQKSYQIAHKVSDGATEVLRQHIEHLASKSNTIDEFKANMQLVGYRVSYKEGVTSKGGLKSVFTFVKDGELGKYLNSSHFGHDYATNILLSLGKGTFIGNNKARSFDYQSSLLSSDSTNLLESKNASKVELDTSKVKGKILQEKVIDLKGIEPDLPNKKVSKTSKIRFN